MKRKLLLLLACVAVLCLVLCACTKPAPQPTALKAPVVSVSEAGVASWAAVENATGYVYKINDGAEQSTTETSVTLSGGQKIVVKAVGNGKEFSDSAWSEEKTYAPAAQPTTLETPVVSVSASGVASWTTIPNATGYKYKVDDGQEISTTETSVQLLHGQTLVVKAVGNGKEFSDSAFCAAVTHTAKALGKPFVVVDEAGVASWNVVNNAISYVYKINDGAEQSTTETSVNLSDGQTLVVKAVGDGKSHHESVWSDQVSYVAPPQLTVLAAPVVTIAQDGVASWQAVEHAAGYKYKIGNGAEQTANGLSVKLINGQTITVKALGDGETYADSAWSEVATCIIPEKLPAPVVAMDDYLAKWQAVSNANGYKYKIDDGPEKQTSARYVMLEEGQTVVVKAIGNGTDYLDSDWSTPVTYTTQLAQLATPVVTIDEEGTASWPAVANALSYRCKIDQGTPFATTVSSRKISDGQTISVQAVGNGINYSDSDWSTPVTFNEQPDADLPKGTWVISSAFLTGQNVLDEFAAFTIIFDNYTMSVQVEHLGISVQRVNSTYTIHKTTLTETSTGFVSETFTYTIGEDEITTVYVENGNSYDITLRRKNEEEVVVSAVDFESVLFGEPITQIKKFNYCPAIIVEEDDQGREVMNIWYCTNRLTGVIMDHIGYRTGVKQEDGKWLFSEEQIVIAPTTGTWDGRHTCDPAVIKGEFEMGGETYTYLMSYLGCVTDDYQKNETGLAVAKDIGGPWIKVDNVNPIVPWYDDGDEETEEALYQSYKGTDRIYWGTGMPALISVDGKGDVLMFYSSTHRGIGVRRWDFSDLDHPRQIFINSLGRAGVVNSRGLQCNISIPDFAFDPTTGRLYCASVTNDKIPEDDTRTRVNSHSMLLYIDGLSNMEAVCEAMRVGGYTWHVVDYVGPQDTGWARNHNPGLVRNCYGYVPDPTKVGMVVSTGCNDQLNENIFTYRLMGHWFPIELNL